MKEKTKFKKEISADYDRIFSTHGLRADVLYYKWIISIFGDMNNKIFLDISCGEGIALREAEKSGARVFGIDISQEALKKAGVNSPKSYLALSDGEKVCFNAEFDYITCLGSLEHYNHPEAGCLEIARLLKDDGKAIIVLPNQFSMHAILDVLFKGKPGGEGFQIVERAESLGRWKEFLESNGLRILKTYKVNERPVIYRNGKLRSFAKFFRNFWFYYLTPVCFAREFAFLCEKMEPAQTKTRGSFGGIQSPELGEGLSPPLVSVAGERMKMFKKSMIKIMAVIFIAIFSFLALEILFRLYNVKSLVLKITTGKELNADYDFEPDKSFELKSSKKNEFDVRVKINNFGFRGKDMKLGKTPGVTRIFMVGDSFTFGVGAEDNQTIPYLTEELIKNKGKNIEIVNAGVGHRSPIVYYVKLRDNYLKFKPDMVVLLLDFSDLRDDWHTEREVIYDKNGEILQIDPTFLNGKKDWWGIAVRNSEVLAYLNNKFVRTFKKMRVMGLKTYIRSAMAGKRAKAVIATSKEIADRIDPIEYDGYLFMRGRDKLPFIEKHWALTGRYLLKIRDLLKQNGVKFTLVIYPYGIHVGPDEWSEGRVYWGFEQGKIYADRYVFDLIEDFCKNNDIHCVNALDSFLAAKKRNPGTKFYFDLDGHMTPAGNRIMAGCISGAIAEKFLNR